MISSIALLASVTLTSGRSSSTPLTEFEVDYYNWYSAKYSENGSVTEALNTGSALGGESAPDSTKSKKFSRMYTPNWTPSGSGSFITYVKNGFKQLKGFSKVVVASAEPELCNEPAGSPALTPLNKAFAKTWSHFTATYADEAIPQSETNSVDDGKLRIYMTLNGVIDEPVQFELFTSGNVLIEEHMHWIEPNHTSSTGSAGMQPAGSYKAYFRPRGALRKRTDFSFDGSSPVSLTVSFLWGDVNGDNTVSQADLDVISHFLGTTVSDPGWSGFDDWSQGDYDGEMCDLNRDGIVNSTDLGMATANLGLNGDS